MKRVRATSVRASSAESTCGTNSPEAPRSSADWIVAVFMSGIRTNSGKFTERAAITMTSSVARSNGACSASITAKWSPAPRRTAVEFVSANPTGPLHVGHGRHAAFGASLANLLEAVGYRVEREYYINDAGRQMEIFAVSTWLRYLERCGEEFAFPANGYRGDYIVAIGAQLVAARRHCSARAAPQRFSRICRRTNPRAATRTSISTR